MSEYEEANGKMSLNPNTERSSSGAPHYKGKGEVAGNLVWASCWINRNEDGSQWMKIQTQPRRSLPEMVQIADNASAETEFYIDEPKVKGKPAEQDAPPFGGENMPEEQSQRDAELIPKPPATDAEKMMREDDVPF